MATASTIINMASKEIGVKETGVNNVKYNTEYYGRAVNGENYPWCAVFVWWVFKHAGASALFCGGAKTASVYEVWQRNPQVLYHQGKESIKKDAVADSNSM